MKLYCPICKEVVEVKLLGIAQDPQANLRYKLYAGECGHDIKTDFRYFKHKFKKR